MQMRRRHRAAFVSAGAGLLLVVLQTASPGAALAQTPADVETARALFVEAAKLGNEGRWKEARELYARSLQLKPAAITRYSLGVAERETGRFADALNSFRAFLTEPEAPGTARFREPACAAITALEARIGHVTIAVEPRSIASLTLTIDGLPVPPTSERPRDIDAGAHDVVARAPGFRPAAARFVVAEGGGAAVTMTLASATATMPSRALVGPLDPRSLLEPTPPPQAPSRKLPFILLGVGGALFVGGATLGLVGVSQAGDAPTQDGSAASSAKAKGIAGDIIGGAGIATAGIGLVLLLTGGKSSPAPSSAGSPTVSASGTGFAVHF
jgi:hypothetical protein